VLKVQNKYRNELGHKERFQRRDQPSFTEILLEHNIFTQKELYETSKSGDFVMILLKRLGTERGFRIIHYAKLLNALSKEREYTDDKDLWIGL